eukprot:1322239-Amorphochlora_amoeboformis.AAC.1
MHEQSTNKHKNLDADEKGAVPAFLMDREGVSRAKVLSNTVKQKRKEKAGKWSVPIPKVKQSGFRVYGFSYIYGPKVSFGFEADICYKELGRDLHLSNNIPLLAGSPYGRSGDVQGHAYRKAEKEILEAYDHEGDLCWGGLHKKATEIRALY